MNILSAKRKSLNLSSVSRKPLCSSRRSSISRFNILLRDFDLNNSELNFWDYYLKIERGVEDHCIYDDCNLENYSRLFEILYSSLSFGNTNYLDEVSKIWEGIINNEIESYQLNKSEIEKLIKSFIGKLFINITNGGLKGYYSAMIYLIIAILPNKQHSVTLIRPFLIRKIIEMINENTLKKKIIPKKFKNRKRITKKNKHQNIDFDSDSDNEEEVLNDEKENNFSGLEKIVNSKDSEDCEEMSILQLKLLSCLIIYCRNFDVSQNISTGLEGFNELIERLSELLLYNEEFPIDYLNKAINLKSIISKVNNYSVNGSQEITSFFQQEESFSISKLATVAIISLFLNLEQNRYIELYFDGKIITKKFRTVKLEVRNIEIILYSVIILFRKLISLTISKSEILISFGNSNAGNKNQNIFNQKIFILIKELVTIFPEIAYPNIIFIINAITEIQNQQNLVGNDINSELESENDYLNESDNNELETLENKSNQKDNFINGVELIQKLKKKISNLKYEEFYYIDNFLSLNILNNNSNNKLFLHDPLIAYIFSIYLLITEKSEIRQNILDQIHTLLIPKLIDTTENKNSSKIILFDILKQSLFDSEDNSIDIIKEINSFISFLSYFRIESKVNSIGNIEKTGNLINLAPFKYPQLLYRRMISILPFMFYSSKPNYRIIAIDIAGYILQLDSSIIILSNFLNNIGVNLTNDKKGTIIDRQKLIFDKILNEVIRIFQEITTEQNSPSINKFRDVDFKNEIISSSRRNSSARQSIEWSGITLEQENKFNNIYNFSYFEMALQLYNIFTLLIERTKDLSPNVRIKSATILSTILTSICEIYNDNSRNNKFSTSGIDILIDDCNSTNKYPIVSLMEIIIDYCLDEKAICRRGSLLLWDSFFIYLKLKKYSLTSKQKSLLILFKKTLTDSSVLVRRHSLQSLYSLFCSFPQYKWVSDLWINYGLPTIIDNENFLVEKMTEISYNMLLEQTKKLSEFINIYNSKNLSMDIYLNNISKEYLFSWLSLKSQKENQIQIINLYRICIRNLFKKYPLLLQHLIQFLNIFIEFFIKFFQEYTLKCENYLDVTTNLHNKYEFPDLPFIIIEEIYFYLNQNYIDYSKKDNIFELTEKIYKVLTEYIIEEKKIILISKFISINNLIFISNSIMETFKVLITTYYNNISDNLFKNDQISKLLVLYENFIFKKPEFYLSITETLINYQDEIEKKKNCNFRCIISSSLSTILSIIHLWDELNLKLENGNFKKLKQEKIFKLQLNNKNYKHNLINPQLKTIFPDLTKNKYVDHIYLNCLIKLSKQITEINKYINSECKYKDLNSDMLNIRILGELFLLNYKYTNLNSVTYKNQDINTSVIESNNVKKIIPFIEEIYKNYKNIYYMGNKINDISSKELESRMSILMLVLGESCYSNSEIAKEIIKKYLIPDLMNDNTPLSIRNNSLIILHDLYILHTTLVDPHLPNLFNIIIKDRKKNDLEDKNSILRKQSILLLSDLIGQGYIKLRGSYLLRFLHSLVDRDSNIRNIAHGLFERVLLKINLSLLVQNFVEIICYLNNWLDHPSIKLFNIEDKLISNKYSGLKDGFDEEEKQYIFKFIINKLTDKQKHEVITRIIHDFLALFVDQSNIVTLPESYDHNDGKALKDALVLLYSSELCIYHKYSKRPFNNKTSKTENNIDSIITGDIKEEILENNKNCTNVLKELIQASLAIDIIPTLLSLKHLMKKSCSPFIKDIHKCIGELLKDYRNNLSVILQDNTLIKELEYDFKMGLI